LDGQQAGCEWRQDYRGPRGLQVYLVDAVFMSMGR
jgi:hypothetical protein